MVPGPGSSGLQRRPCAMPQRSRAATRDPEPSYRAWKAAAANALQRRHGLAATAIPEREWSRFYVLCLSAADAADRAEREYRSTRPPDWLKKR